MMRWGDAVLIAACAALVGVAFGLAWQPRETAAWALLRAPDAPPRRVALDGPRSLVVPGSRGDSRLRVDHGRIRFVASPCPGKHCIHSGWLDAAGDFAACLPNGVSLTLAADGLRYDALAY